MELAHAAHLTICEAAMVVVAVDAVPLSRIAVAHAVAVAAIVRDGRLLSREAVLERTVSRLEVVAEGPFEIRTVRVLLLGLTFAYAMPPLTHLAHATVRGERTHAMALALVKLARVHARRVGALPFAVELVERKLAFVPFAVGAHENAEAMAHAALKGAVVHIGSRLERADAVEIVLLPLPLVVLAAHAVPHAAPFAIERPLGTFVGRSEFADVVAHPPTGELAVRQVVRLPLAAKVVALCG